MQELSTIAAASQPLGGVIDPAGRAAVFEKLHDMWISFLQLLPNLVIALVVLGVFALLARLGFRIARGVAKRARLRSNLRNLAAQLVYIGIWITGVFVVATIIFPSVTPGRMIAGLGITSIALGFAFKDIVENFVAGVLILWRFPVQIGDYIEVTDIEGTIEEINIRMTILRQVDGDLVAVPNAMLFKNPMTNHTNWSDRRTTVICGVAYGEDVGRSREVIRRAVEACSTVRTDGHNVEIFAQEFGESSINFEVTWWTGSRPLEIRQSRDEVVEAVKRALDEAGIEIPFPYRTLTFKEPLPLSHIGGHEADSA